MENDIDSPLRYKEYAKDNPLAMANKDSIDRNEGEELNVPCGFSNELLRFKPDEWRIAKCLGEGKKVLDVANELGIAPERVERVVASRKFKTWFHDKMQLVAIAQGWTQERILKELEDVWYGRTEKGKGQIEVMRMMKDMIHVKEVKKTEEKPIININLGNAVEALRRQEVIDAELLNDGNRPT